jgi:gliding motility-associated lipoprotein GldH
MNQGFRASLLLLQALLLLAACNNTIIFEKNTPIDNSLWESSNIVEIDFTIQDTINPVNLIFNIRHSTSYEFSNLFLFIDTRYPDGRKVRDTLEIILAGHDGRWFGKGFGKIKELNIPVRRGLIFPMQGQYTFVFEQAMRVNELKGIEDIGITIEKSDGF